MKRLIPAIATLGALACAQAASAQAVPPGAPPSDPMHPYAPPPGMESHDNSEQTRINSATHDREAERQSRKSSRGSPASPADVTAGSTVSDSRGVEVGRIESVDSDGDVVATAAGKVKVPLEAFGKNRKGLILGITKAEFDAAVAGATAGG